MFWGIWTNFPPHMKGLGKFSPFQKSFIACVWSVTIPENIFFILVSFMAHRLSLPSSPKMLFFLTLFVLRLLTVTTYTMWLLKMLLVLWVVHIHILQYLSMLSYPWCFHSEVWCFHLLTATIICIFAASALWCQICSLFCAPGQEW